MTFEENKLTTICSQVEISFKIATAFGCRAPWIMNMPCNFPKITLGPQKNEWEWMVDQFIKMQNMHTHHEPPSNSKCDLLHIPAVEDAQCLGPLGVPPPHQNQPSITPQLRLARGQLCSRGTRQLTGIIIHLSSIYVLLYRMVGISDEVIERLK